MSTISSPPTLYTEGVKSLSEAIMKPTYEHPELTTYCTPVTGIQHDKQIVLLDSDMTGLMGRSKPDCDKTPADVSFGNSTKLWSVKEYKDRIAECYSTLMTSFWKYSLKPGMTKEDLTATDWADYMAMRFPNELRKHHQQKAWFSDTAIVAGTNNSSGTGNEKFFNLNSGWWKQIFAIVTASSARRTSEHANWRTRNDATTFATQKFVTADIAAQVVTSTLDQMYYDAESTLTADKSNLQYLVSRSVYMQLERERKYLGNSALELTYLRMENGVDAIKLNGIPVIPMETWDKNLRLYFGQDSTNVATYLPHRAILIKKQNLLLGTEDEASMKAFDMFYDKVSGNNYIDWATNLDFKVGVDDQIQVAY